MTPQDDGLGRPAALAQAGEAAQARAEAITDEALTALLREALLAWMLDESAGETPVKHLYSAVRPLIAAPIAVEMARKAAIAEAERDSALAAAERHYAAFVGAEAELARLKSEVARVGHRGSCPVFPCDCWRVELAPLVEDDR